MRRRGFWQAHDGRNSYRLDVCGGFPVNESIVSNPAERSVPPGPQPFRPSCSERRVTDAESSNDSTRSVPSGSVMTSANRPHLFAFRTASAVPVSNKTRSPNSPGTEMGRGPGSGSVLPHSSARDDSCDDWWVEMEHSGPKLRDSSVPPYSNLGTY
jgi:hypothetical protein